MWAIMFTAFLFALSLTTTANALVVMSLSPLLTALFASLFLKDPVPLRTWLAAGVCAVGIGVMFGSSMEKHFLGMAVAFLILVAAAINVVVLRASAAKLDLVPAVMLGGALSCLIALPLALPFSSTGRDIALLAFLGITQLAALRAAGARQPRAARAGNRAARPARSGARSALGLARRARSPALDAAGRNDRARRARGQRITHTCRPARKLQDVRAMRRLAFSCFSFLQSPWRMGPAGRPRRSAPR